MGSAKPADLTERGSNSVVECQLPKLDVAGSSPVSRSKLTCAADFPGPLKRRLRVPELHNVALWRGGQADGYAKEFGPSLEVSISARVFESYAFAVESALRCWWLICRRI